MKFSKCVNYGVAVAMLWGAVSTASATESGVYVGLNLGMSKFEVDSEVERYFTSGAGRGLDDSDTAYSFAVGARVNPYVALELSYSQFGEATAYETPSGVREEVAFESKGATLALIGSVPFGNFEINGRYGILVARTKLKFDDEYESATSQGYVFGLGGGYTFSEHYYVGLQLTRNKHVGEVDETTQMDIDTYTASFQYRF